MKSDVLRIVRATFLLALGIVCLPLLLLFFVWWLLRNHWGLRSRETQTSIPVLPTMDFGHMFKEKRPVLLTDVVRQWAAFSKWTPAYLSRNLGDQEVEVFANPLQGGDPIAAYVTGRRRRMKFSELISLVFSQEISDRLYYLWGGGLRYLKHLRCDIALPACQHVRLDERGSGLWIGHKGNLTPLHYDTWQGCLAQLSGRKRVTLISPQETSNIYQASPWSLRSFSTRLPQHSKDADATQFPKTRRLRRLEVVLEPGQLLYIPPYWWHEVESLDNSISLAVRYGLGFKELVREAVVQGAVFPALWTTLVRRPIQQLHELRGKRVANASGAQSSRLV
jgi:Cupin-like domain